MALILFSLSALIVQATVQENRDDQGLVQLVFGRKADVFAFDDFVKSCQC